MDWQTVHQQTLAFLQSEEHILQQKVSRQRNGFRAPNHDGCCAAEWDLEILKSIITIQQGPDALSLESALLVKEADLQRQIMNIQWRHGKPSPPEYWRLECRRAYLVGLLNRYHAFRRSEATFT